MLFLDTTSLHVGDRKPTDDRQELCREVKEAHVREAGAVGVDLLARQADGAWKDGWTWMKEIFSSSTTRAESQWVSFVRCVDEAAHAVSSQRCEKEGFKLWNGLEALNEVLS